MKRNSMLKLKATTRAVFACMLGGALTLPLAAYAKTVTEPAQAPLVAVRKSASPNIMVLFDNSGSMTAMTATDEFENFLFNYPMDRGQYHPGDTSSVRGSEYDNYRQRYTLAAHPSDLLSAIGRSPQINKLYYNPAVTYLPWAKADGTYMPPANPSATKVYAGPRGRYDKPSPVVNLVGAMKLRISPYCHWDGGIWGGAACTDTGGKVDFYPAIYFIYKGTADGWDPNDPNIRNINNYTPVVIEQTPTEGRRQPATRTDCGLVQQDAGGQYVMCSKEQEYQNFANWYQYYRGRTRAAIGSLSQVFAKDFGMHYRLGWGDFGDFTKQQIRNYNTTEEVKAGNGAQRVLFYDWLYGFETDSNESTPSRRALKAIGDYYRKDQPWWGNPDGTNKTMLACRKAYTIFISDGGWNDSNVQNIGNEDKDAGGMIKRPDGTQVRSYQGGQPPYTDEFTATLADVAMYYWKRDLKPDINNEVPVTGDDPAFWQHMVTHTIGFGAKGNLNPEKDLPALSLAKGTPGAKSWGNPWSSQLEKIDDLWHAAVNSRGTYTSASDSKKLIDSLSAIMESIATANITAPYSVNNSDYLTESNRAYVSTYMSGSWFGNLSAYGFNRNGTLNNVPKWSAEAQLPAANARNIWIGTDNSNRLVEFQWSSVAAVPALKTALGNNEAFLRYLRGEKIAGMRDRGGHLIGDIVNSKPAYVKDGSSLRYSKLVTTGAIGYSKYLSNRKSRMGVVFVGANDGMLHAFEATTGKEVFAYIPYGITSKLGELKNNLYDKNHQYYVDGPLSLTDAYWGNCPDSTAASAAPCWHNVLFGSTGAGSKTVFALDVTNPDTYAKTASNTPTLSSIKDTVLWEISATPGNLKDLGYVMWPVQGGFVNPTPSDKTAGQWVGIFGNGPYSENGKAALMVVNLQTGDLIASVAAGSDTDNGLTGVTLITNKNRRVTGAYAGDLKGNLWRFNLTGDKATWSATRIFTTRGSRPIAQAPVYTRHPKGGYMVLFGTGKFYDETDIDDSGKDYVYGIWDKDGSTSVSTNELLDRKTTPVVSSGKTYYNIDNQTMNWAEKKGWSLRLDMIPSLRSLYQASLAGKEVRFDLSATSESNNNTSQEVETCEVAGLPGVMLRLNLFTGGNPPGKWDTNGDGRIDASDVYYVGKWTNNNGTNSILSHPRLGSQGVYGSDGCKPGEAYTTDVATGSPYCTPAVDNTARTQMF